MRAEVGHAAGHRAGGATRGDGTGGERALGHRVDLAVSGEQRGDQQGAAGQVGGVAQCGDGDIDPAAAAGEGGQIGGHHDGGDVLGGQLGHLVPRVHAEALQHPDQRFAGEHRVVQLVAGVVQPDHQAVADELVLADALDIGDVLDAHLGQGRQSGHEGNQQGQQVEEAVQGGLGGSGCVRNLRQSRAGEGKSRASAKQPQRAGSLPWRAGMICRVSTRSRVHDGDRGHRLADQAPCREPGSIEVRLHYAARARRHEPGSSGRGDTRHVAGVNAELAGGRRRDG